MRLPSTDRQCQKHARRRTWCGRALIALERIIKSLVVDCQTCSNCILPETAYICPMTCAGGLRNGPCRGSTPNRCAANPTRPCTWFMICQKAEAIGTLEDLLEVNAPLDNSATHGDLCLSTLRLRKKYHGKLRLRDLKGNRSQFEADLKRLRYEVRQPDWWQGDNQYHPPLSIKPVSILEAKLRAGHFVISAEVAPPLDFIGNRIQHITQHYFKNNVDTANFTDNPLGVPRMSGLTCAMQSLENEMEPVLQLQTRHRNRYNFESEALGAVTVGVRNILCLADDFGRLGPGPTPRPEANDIDAIQALWMLRRLRDEGVDVDGHPIPRRPRYFLGAAASPYAAIPRYEAIATEKKINAGAQFLQTMPVFDLPRFADWMEALDKRNLIDKVYLMPTVAPLRNPRYARFMANDVPGVFIPPPVMARLENAADPQEEGIQIALELLVTLRRMQGISGIHILAPNQEEIVPRLIEESGIRDTAMEIELKSHVRPAREHPDDRWKIRPKDVKKPKDFMN